MTGSAALALARLAQLDPGGRWANRPDRSLNQIFLPWRPQTTATPDERLAVIDMLRRRAAPQVAWPFLAGLLPTPHSISETSHQPRWREWHLDYQPPQMGVAEWSRHAEVITGWLLEGAGLAGTHWADLIARLPNLPEAQHDLILDRTYGRPASWPRPDRSTSNTISVTGTAASSPAPGLPVRIRRCSAVKSGREPDRATISPSRTRVLRPATAASTLSSG
jgi:hypothetical protein